MFGEAGAAAMGAMPSLGVLFFVLLSSPVVRGYYDLNLDCNGPEICALVGSKVSIKCSSRNQYIYLDSYVDTFWFAKRDERNEPIDLQKDDEYKGRVKNYCAKRTCTLTISDVRQSDSAVYKLVVKGYQVYVGNTGVSLVVTDLPNLTVQIPTRYYKEVNCGSSCVLPTSYSIVWYKNGVKHAEVDENTFISQNNFQNEDSVSCAVKGHEASPSPSKCVNEGKTCRKVNYVERRICGFVGSSVNISCTYSTRFHWDASSKFWFLSQGTQSPDNKDLSQDARYSRRVSLSEKPGVHTLTITGLRESDSAEYRFTFASQWFRWGADLPGTTLTVAALQVHVSRVSSDQAYTKAELQCHSVCAPAGRLSYSWLKNRAVIAGGDSKTFTLQFRPDDEISCAVNVDRGRQQFTSAAVYAPKPPRVSARPSAELVEGSSVTLTCSSDANPAANYTWYKGNPNPAEALHSVGPELVLSDVRAGGEYRCAVENVLGRRMSESTSVLFDYAPRSRPISVSPPDGIVEGSSVTLTCTSDASPAASYTWSKGDHTLAQEEGVYRLPSVRPEDSGVYRCKAENKHGQVTMTVRLDVQYAPKQPSVTMVTEGSSVTLTCSSDANPAANYTWFKEGENSPAATGQNFTVADFSSNHGGSYYCEAQNSRGRRTSMSHATPSASKASLIKSATGGSLAVVFLGLIFCFACVVMRRRLMKKTLRETPHNRAQDSEIRLTGLERKPEEELQELHYASVRFGKTQDEPVYSNVNRPKDKREDEEDEEDVEYTSVNFTRSSSERSSEASLDALSSAVCTPQSKNAM